MDGWGDRDAAAVGGAAAELTDATPDGGIVDALAARDCVAVRADDTLGEELDMTVREADTDAARAGVRLGEDVDEGDRAGSTVLAVVDGVEVGESEPPTTEPVAVTTTAAGLAVCGCETKRLGEGRWEADEPADSAGIAERDGTVLAVGGALEGAGVNVGVDV